MVGWLVIFAVALALSVASYLLTPKPKAPKPQAAKDLEDPVAEAGMEIPVVVGTITVQGLNVLWFGDKRVRNYKVKA